LLGLSSDGRHFWPVADDFAPLGAFFARRFRGTQ
jgi:hypothetical protein